MYKMRKSYTSPEMDVFSCVVSLLQESGVYRDYQSNTQVDFGGNVINDNEFE